MTDLTRPPHAGAQAGPAPLTSQDDRCIARLRDLLDDGTDAEHGGSKVQVLHGALFDMIERGLLRPGEKLPGEKELSQSLQLSLGTVQAALRMLVNARLIVRRRRAGSFVADAKKLGSSVWHFRFRKPGAEVLLPWVSQVLSVEVIQAEGPWSDFLGQLPDYIRIRRVIRVNDEFDIYAEMHLEGARFRPLLDIPLDVLSGKNLRIFIHERFNVPTFRAEHRVSATRINADIAARLGVPPGAVGMDVKALSYGFRGAPASYQWMIVPENPYEMEFLG